MIAFGLEYRKLLFNGLLFFYIPPLEKKEFEIMNKKDRQIVATELVNAAKDLVAEDNNPWGWYGGDIIKHTEENISRIQKTLKEPWPEGYKSNLKRDLKRLQDDLKKYKKEIEKAKKAKVALTVDKDKSKKLTMLKLLNKAMSSMPGSPEQKKLINELNKHRKDFGLKPLAASAMKKAKSGVVLINDLWNDEKYFTRRGLDSTDRSVVQSVNQLDDVITMGKIIGVPVQFWKPQDKADFRKHGLDSKFMIASKVAASPAGKLDDLMGDILYDVSEFDEDEDDAQDNLQTILWNIDEALGLIRRHRDGQKTEKLLKLLRKEVDEVWQDLENDEPTAFGRARRVMDKLEDVYLKFTRSLSIEGS
jgi:hypothetical protein